MAKFRYTAVDSAGKVIKGVLEAPDRAAIVKRLQSDRHMPLTVSPVGSLNGVWSLLNADVGGAKGIGAQDLASFTRELAVMLEAGQDLDRALRYVVDTTHGAKPRAVFTAVRDQVRDGASLASALSSHPGSFPRLYVGMVRAGEAGGTLGETLGRLAQLLDRDRALRASIQSAMIYPALLLAAAIGTIILLLAYVLPQFTPIFSLAGAKLPTATRLLMEAGDAVRAHGALAILGLTALGLLLRQIAKQPGPDLAFARLALLAPVLGEVIRQGQAARFTRTLGTLLGNGVGLLQALTIVRDVMSNRAALQVIDSTIAGVKDGAGLAASLSSGKIFPVRTIDLLRLGEETGRLADMALRAAEIHEERVRQLVQRLVALLVPVITIVTGVIVSGIIASLVVAMLSLNEIVL